MTSVNAIDEQTLEILKNIDKKELQDIYDKSLQLSDNNSDSDKKINDLEKLHDFILNKPILLELLMKINAMRTEDLRESNKYTHQFTESEIEEYSKLTKDHPEAIYINLMLSDFLREWFVFDAKQLLNLKPGEPNIFLKVAATATELVLTAFEVNTAVPGEIMREYIVRKYNNLKRDPTSDTFEISEPLLERLSDTFIKIWTKRLEYLETLKIKENPIDRAVYGTKDLIKKGAKKVGNVGKVIGESKVVNDIISSQFGALLLFLIVFIGFVALICWLFYV